jgi:hypothetical protein
MLSSLARHAVQIELENFNCTLASVEPRNILAYFRVVGAQVFPDDIEFIACSHFLSLQANNSKGANDEFTVRILRAQLSPLANPFERKQGRFT